MQDSEIFPEIIENLFPDTIVDTDNVGFAGHSRGGKVAFNLIQHKEHWFKAIAGIDPVETAIPQSSDPAVVTDNLYYDAPTLLIGTGKGPDGLLGGPACAPIEDGHEHFYKFAPSPAYHIVATDFGHMEMLDEKDLSSPLGCGTTCATCASSKGENRDDFRHLVAGMLAGFMRAALIEKDNEIEQQNLYDQLTDPVAAIVPVITDSK